MQFTIFLKYLILCIKAFCNKNSNKQYFQVRKQERLNAVFMSHALSSWTQEPSWTWPGELPGPALTILHQSAVQGDLTDLQAAGARWAAACRLNAHDAALDPK